MAVLIDADNTQLQKLADILTEVSAYGRIIVKKAYGNFKKPALAKWENVIKELAIKAVQQFDYVSGKNTTDIAMVIDAMDLLHLGLYDAIVLVSSDSDFTKLASRLRESRMFVIGMGETKTPTAFKAACDTFKYLEVLLGTKTEEEAVSPARGGKRTAEKAAAEKSAKEKPAQAPGKAEKADRPEKADSKADRSEKGKKAPRAAAEKDAPAARAQPEPPLPVQEDELETAIAPLSKIISTIESLIDHDCDEDGWMQLSQIGVMLGRIYADFDSRNYGYSRLHKLIDATGRFDTKCEPLPAGGQNLLVRNR